MKYIKKVVACVGALGLLTCFSACTSNSGATQQAGGKTKISVWHYWDGANADTFDSMVKDFNQSHPNIEVEVSGVPNSDYMTKLRAAAGSKTLPDISIVDLIWVPQIEQLGACADIKTVIPDKTTGNINSALMKFGAIGGKQVSVPVSANNLAYMYNKTLYKEAGLDPNVAPKTWEELKANAQQITKVTGKPGYDLFTQANNDGEGLTWNFQVNLWQAGGEFLTPDNTKAAFNTPAGEKALQFWVDLIKSGTSPYAKWGEFEKGRGGSAQEGSWMVGIWAPDPPFDFGVGKAPYPADGKPATNLGGEQAMLFNNSEEKTQAAGQFLDWFLQDSQVTQWSEKTGMLPVTDSVAKSSDYMTWVKEKQPRLLPYVEQMSQAHARPNTPLYPKISFAFAKEIEKALSGDVTPKEALMNAEKAVNEVIKQG